MNENRNEYINIVKIIVRRALRKKDYIDDWKNLYKSM